MTQWLTCGNSSVGRALASQAEGREFEPRFPLVKKRQSVEFHALPFFYLINY